jgi:hypothetical protein
MGHLKPLATIWPQLGRRAERFPLSGRIGAGARSSTRSKLPARPTAPVIGASTSRRLWGTPVVAAGPGPGGVRRPGRRGATSRWTIPTACGPTA